MITFHGDARDADVLQWLKGFDGAGEGAGNDLADVEQVSGDQDEIDLLADGVSHHVTKHAEEVLVAFGFACRGAVGFAQVNVGGVNEIY